MKSKKIVLSVCELLNCDTSLYIIVYKHNGSRLVNVCELQGSHHFKQEKLFWHFQYMSLVIAKKM